MKGDDYMAFVYFYVNIILTVLLNVLCLEISAVGVASRRDL